MAITPHSDVATWTPEAGWRAGNHPVMGAADHAAWLGSGVFDGARRIAARIVASAAAMGFAAPVAAEEIHAVLEEGCKLFAPGTALYLRPMMWARDSGGGVIDLDPASGYFCACIEAMPMPEPGGFSLTVSPYRRPRPDMAVTDAKAAALYANNGRIMAEARARGFSNALSLDPDGNVAETASTNVFLVRDGEVFTPVPNGTFLAGLTRARVIALLRDDGVAVHETVLTVEDFATAEEIFVTGNIAKVMPVARFEDRALNAGPIAARARALYWDWAHGS